MFPNGNETNSKHNVIVRNEQGTITQDLSFVKFRLVKECGDTIRLTCTLHPCELILSLHTQKLTIYDSPCNHKSLHTLKRTTTQK